MEDLKGESPREVNVTREDMEDTGTLGHLGEWFQEHKLAAALSGGLALATFEHPPVTRAAEIAPEASWEEGVNVLRESVFSETLEQGAFFITEPKGSRGVWVSMRFIQKEEGNPFVYISEPPHITLFHLNIRDPKSFNKKSRACWFHTHPLRVTKEWFADPADKKKVLETQNISQATLTTPPSFLDFHSYSSATAGLAGQDYPIPSLEGAVAVPAGVWYYGLASDSKQKVAESFFLNCRIEKDPLDIYNILQAGVNVLSLEGPMQPDDEQTLKLAANYAGYDIRFVPYEKLSEEPLCAGVNYKPKE